MPSLTNHLAAIWSDWNTFATFQGWATIKGTVGYESDCYYTNLRRSIYRCKYWPLIRIFCIFGCRSSWKKKFELNSDWVFGMRDTATAVSLGHLISRLQWCSVEAASTWMSRKTSYRCSLFLVTRRTEENRKKTRSSCNGIYKSKLSILLMKREMSQRRNRPKELNCSGNRNTNGKRFYRRVTRTELEFGRSRASGNG